MARATSIGDLRHRLRFETQTSTTDAQGYSATSWATAFTVWGAARDVSGSEFFEAAAQHMENIVTFTVRSRTDINTSMRIVFQSKPYEIVQVDQMDYRGVYTRIKARWMGGEGV